MHLFIVGEHLPKGQNFLSFEKEKRSYFFVSGHFLYDRIEGIAKIP